MSPRPAVCRTIALVALLSLGLLVSPGIAAQFDPGSVSMNWDLEVEFGTTTVFGPGDLPMSVRRELGPGVALPARGIDMVVEAQCGEGAVAYTDGLVCVGLVDGLDVSEGGNALRAAADTPDLVVEPATFALLGTGLGMMAARRRRSRAGAR